MAEVGVEEEELTRLEIHCWRNLSVTLGDDLMVSFKLCMVCSPASSGWCHSTRIRHVVGPEAMLGQ